MQADGKRLELLQQVENLDLSQLSSDELDSTIKDKLLPQFKTWLEVMFEGQLVSITKCQVCEHESIREETFMNLSVDIEENVSLGYCMKKFSVRGLLNKSDKYYCETCQAKQVATRQMMIKNRPKLMLTHLKRFKMNFQTMTN